MTRLPQEYYYAEPGPTPHREKQSFDDWSKMNETITTQRIRDAITARLTSTQYYCEYCEQVFEYRDLDQHGCEQCNHAIQDNNIVEMETGLRS